MRTNNLISQTVRQNIFVDIVTTNHFLKKGLSLIINECGDRQTNLIEASTENHNEVRVCLIDVDSLCEQKAHWRHLCDRLRKAESVIFVSRSEIGLKYFPHIILNQPVKRIIQTLRGMITCVRKDNHVLSNDALVSPLSYFEKEVFLFMMCGNSVFEISSSLQKTHKTIYRAKSQIMNKFNLHDRKGLFRMLVLSEFLQFYSCERYSIGAIQCNSSKPLISV